ncbi:MAG: hypothetical protein RDU59_12320 [Thermodesulfobacteriota bacterium]|nr:hypothetical protein [Thermodesulfobacteriota bacterium]
MHLLSESRAPDALYLMLYGKGDPNSPAFQAAFNVLFGTASTIKFSLKKPGMAGMHVPGLKN